MNREDPEKLLDDLAGHYHDPPAVPRERIWASIEAARTKHRRTLRFESPFRRWRLWPVAAAAALVIGIWIGHAITGTDPTLEPEPQSQATFTGRSDSIQRTEPLRQTAAPLLGRIETLLMVANAEGDRECEGIGKWAADLLSETRLLMNAPGKGDEELQSLLVDLELVLAQIVLLANRSDGESDQWIRDNIRRRSLLLRLRNQTPIVQATAGIGRRT